MRISDWSSDVCSSDLELSRNLVFQALCGGERDLASGRDLHRFARARIASRAGRRRFDAEFSEAVDVDLFTGGGRVADRSDYAVAELASIGFADRTSTRLNSSHYCASRMPSSASKTTPITHPSTPTTHPHL